MWKALLNFTTLAMMPHSMTIQQILIKYWGYSSFRPMQEDIINSVLANQDTLGLLPTGGGKSICFQVPALKMPGICIVVTPLIALMKDQVENLKKKGVDAVAIYSGMTPREIDICMDNCVYGEKKFLYLSPERLGTDMFRERVQKMQVNMLAIDEAHCISQWGYDFRPSYTQIAEIRQLIPDVPVIALTATATPSVVEDIMQQLHFRSRNFFQKSFARDNLTYTVNKIEDKHKRLIRILQRNQGTGIIYVRNRKKTHQIARLLIENQISAHYYHAGLEHADRERKQADWMHGRVRYMVCTNAFGMGIDKPDVRLVVHMDIPESPEAYFQEAGRAGRDGKASVAVLIYNNADLINLTNFFEAKYPKPEFIKQVYKLLGNYYQLAYGSGEDESFEFDLSTFAKMYDLAPLLTYNALKFLEKEGYIMLSDAAARSSKMHIKVGKEELYRIQVKNPSIGDFLDLIIRSYSGLFTEFVNISEQQLAMRMNIKRSLVDNLIQRLTKANIIDYHASSTKPQLTFSRERLVEDEVRITKEHYYQRKAYDKERMEAMVHYVKSTNKCRSVILLEYFGESGSKRCGKCDACLKRNMVDLSEFEFDEILNIVKPMLQARSHTFDTLIDGIPEVNEERLIKVVQWLIENDKIKVSGQDMYWSM